MHAPCSNRTVTVPSPDHRHALTKTGQQPNKDLTRTVPGLFHRPITVLSPCCHWTLHGPCMRHALTMLASNQARTEHRPYCDRAMTITALEPCRNWTVQGPCEDRAGTRQGPCCNRSFTVLSPCHNRTDAESGKTMLLPAIVRHSSGPLANWGPGWGLDKRRSARGRCINSTKLARW